MITILAVGQAKKFRVFASAVGRIPAARLVGILDPSPSPEGVALARKHGLPLYRSQNDLADWKTLDAVLLAGKEPDKEFFDPASLPRGVEVLRGAGARLMRRLAGALARQKLETGRLRGARRIMERSVRDVDDLIGKSGHILEIRELIRMVAPTPTPVLLLGETGTGKDLAARAIHGASLVKGQPFVAVNCTALTGTLMESELFGYKKGAFTGADEDRAGLMEEADGGTLFLDEIGDMPLELQARLLRFLQTGEVRRVGDTKTRSVDVRVVAATNRDMSAMVEDASFRRDLYYRFNTFTITLKPLRQRREDIPYLAYHCLTRAEAKLNRKIDEIHPQAMAALCAYSWPGNIRELSNVLERAVILCRGSVLTTRELPGQLLEDAPESGAGCPSPGTPIPRGAHAATKDRGLAAARGHEQASAHEPTSLSWPGPAGDDCSGRDRDGDQSGFCDSRERIVSTFERTELMVYLRKAGGNVSEACRLSGVPRRTFYRKMKKYGL